MSKKNKIKTWVQLYERLGRQRLIELKQPRITLKNEDGSLSFLTLAYDANGSSWWFEKIE